MRVDPPFWWAGMQEPSLELLLIGDGISRKEVSIRGAGVKLVRVEKAEEEQYLYLRLDLSEAKPGIMEILVSEGRQQEVIPYEIRSRGGASRLGRRRGIDGADFIYLLMPDRFANGDPKNDDVKGMYQRGVGRDSILLRHGGDLKGIADHLDYFVDLGVTTLWLNPVQENNEPKESYHGYAITDHYRIDPRLGDNETYRRLVADCHQRGLKMLMDMVYNHWGDKHYLNSSLPSPDWVHQQTSFQRTSYRANTLIDPHASQTDLNVFTNGWFDRHMPDLNQKNPHVARYLIQNSIWWIEYAELDGFRIDTWLYSDRQFMSDLLTAIFKEYPDFGVFGETWVQGTALQAYVSRNRLSMEPAANLPGVTDFQLYYAINDGLTKKMGWNDGIALMYQTLAEDFLYADASQNVIFLDNHDLSRFYMMVGEDLRKWKMGVAWLCTMRGIPQFFYGTEILMKSWANPDAKVRMDFPGGWAGDATNKFAHSGRTAPENEAYDYLKRLLSWRKRQASLLREGKLIHFVPVDGIYVYFRQGATGESMVIMNCNDEGKEVQMERFGERLRGVTHLIDAITEVESPLGERLTLAPWSTLVLDLKR